jgi:DNA-binding SARP family transcriptional activator
MLELALLGHPQIRLDGESLSIPSKKSQALLYFLALSERPHSRTALAGLLWGGKRESDGRRNLRVELTKLRRILPGYLVVTHTTVGFDHAQPYRLDVAELRAIAMVPLFNIAHSKRTVALVRGELLEDLQLQDAREFEAWLITEQEECRQLHLSLLQAIIGQCQQSHNFQDALSYSQQLLDMEPWREESHRLVIRLLAQSDQRSAALAQYEKCRQILAQELGVEPSPETR